VKYKTLSQANVFKGIDPRNQGGPGGLPGRYRVVFLLNRPGYHQVLEYQFSFVGPLKGDSHLAITKPAFTPPDPGADRIKISAVTPDGQFEFTGYPNDKGFLGKIETAPFQADNRFDAERKAYRALLRAMSSWSIHLDIPLEVEVMETTEVRTSNSGIRVTTPFFEAPWAIQATTPPWDSEFAHFSSLYREGLSSNSSVYRFLCFFKIIEAVRVRRARLGAEARACGGMFSRPVEDVPDNAEQFVKWLNAIFPSRREWDDMTLSSIFVPESQGKRFSQLVASELNPLRDRIAHAISRTGDLALSVDELLQVQRVNHWLPLVRCMARRMLKNEFPTQFLPYLKEDGTIEKTLEHDGEEWKQKHDRRDARLLLKLLAEDRFPTIWMPSTQQRDLRTLLRHRHQWVRLRWRRGRADRLPEPA